MGYRLKTKSIQKLDRYDWYWSADECAKAAAPIFAWREWGWGIRGTIPDMAAILTALVQLKNIGLAHGARQVEAGRLIYKNGRYGHERPVFKCRYCGSDKALSVGVCPECAEMVTSFGHITS